MTTDETTASRLGVYESMAPWERAAQWEQAAPETAKGIIQLVNNEQLHRHRIARLEMARQVFSVLLGFGTVLAMVVVAWHYADVGEPVAGASFAGAGMVSTAAIFVTGKRPTSPRRRR
ncbi:hypothetical protein [Streptomyces pseudovenezuelae]|uniref:hypothetical protein n=1 Tax=Streptomyces pseudovenezuelae TaxID=67350 RepID=UPI002E80A9DC|nr:hypothetical protein [Streptomyces pseudovenezuelae]WUA85961.1 hypothetical protein OHO81_01050 [Streptomyces pseudovenezuelae]